MTIPVKPAVALLCGVVLAIGLSACTEAVSTSGFKGEAKAVAQTLANLQSDVTTGDQHKICAEDLASAVVARLAQAPGGCQQAIKNQMDEVDSPNLTVESVQVSTAGARNTASARVKSVYSGKNTVSSVSLVKEGGKWKVSALG
jgi:hypothetical protein